MVISTKGRYAVRILIDMAEHQDEGYIPLKEIASRQEISQKYMEKIMLLLTKANFVEGQHGKGGGYRLSKAPSDCNVGDVLRATEGDLAPVACLQCDSKICARSNKCKSLPMWKQFYKLTNDYFNNIAISDLI